MDLSGFFGNNTLKKSLESLSGKNISHALIIEGAKGGGKRTLARIIANSVVCSSKSGPCGRCRHCRKTALGFHPDVININVGEYDIKVDDVRDIRREACVMPSEAEKKVFIINFAERMNIYAQNAFLKILEEPPPHCVFILLTENTSSLLPTVLSRCVVYTLKPVLSDDIMHILKNRFPEKEEKELDFAAKLCGGIPGRAIDLVLKKPLLKPSALLEAFAEAIISPSYGILIIEFCVSLEKLSREDLSDFLNDAESMLCDSVLLKTKAKATPYMLYPDLSGAVSVKLTLPALLGLTELIRTLSYRCDMNAGSVSIAGALLAYASGLINGRGENIKYLS